MTMHREPRATRALPTAAAFVAAAAITLDRGAPPPHRITRR